jgi:hypothetical protein
MKAAIKVGLCALVVGVSVGFMASAVAGGSGESGSEASAAVAATAVNDTATESKFTPIRPCRIVNTQSSGGILAAGTTRAFVATGTTGFEVQGGRAGGCGIPDAATAIQVVITAQSATGKGVLRAFAANHTTPGAIFMNYTNLYSVTGGGVVQLAAGSPDFKVNAATSATHLHIDVQGYYISPMFALVSSNGTLLKGPRAASVRTDAGRYLVTFDRDVTSCGVSAQATGSGQADIWLQTVGTAVDVDVESPDLANAQLDNGFYVVVTC